MRERETYGFRWRVVVALVALACTLRVGMILALGAHQTDAGAYEHEEIATSLADGNGFRIAFFNDAPLLSSHQAPAVPFLLSVCFRIAGGNTPTARLLYLLGVNVVLSGVATFALWQLGRRMWNPSVGMWAAVVLAAYPPLVYATTRIQAVTWSVCWLLITLALVMEAIYRRSWKWAIPAGASAAGGLLGEPILLFPAAFVFLAVLIHSISPPRRVGMAVTCLTAAAVVLAPWLIRNAVVHQRFVFVKSTFWYAFWQGNHPGASGTDKVILDESLRRRLAWTWGGVPLEQDLNAARGQAVSVDSHLSAETVAEIMAQSGEIEKVNFFKRLALRQLSERPGDYIRMCGVRLGQMLWFDPTNPRAYVLGYRSSYLMLVPLAVGGTWLSMTSRRARYGYLPVLAGLGILLLHTLVITSARFRLPIEALLVLPAGVVFATLAEAVGRISAKAASAAATSRELIDVSSAQGGGARHAPARARVPAVSGHLESARTGLGVGSESCKTFDPGAS